MAKVTRVYTAQWTHNLVGADLKTSRWSIISSGREISIKSVLINFHALISGTAVTIPFETMVNQYFQFAIHNETQLIDSTVITSNFEEFTGTAPGQVGRQLAFRTPGQYFFESCFFKNKVCFEIISQNFNAGITIDLIYNITIETEERIIY